MSACPLTEGSPDTPDGSIRAAAATAAEIFACAWGDVFISDQEGSVMVKQS